MPLQAGLGEPECVGEADADVEPDAAPEAVGGADVVGAPDAVAPAVGDPLVVMHAVATAEAVGGPGVLVLPSDGVAAAVPDTLLVAVAVPETTGVPDTVLVAVGDVDAESESSRLADGSSYTDGEPVTLIVTESVRVGGELADAASDVDGVREPSAPDGVTVT
jgi:hypothetical protein